MTTLPGSKVLGLVNSLLLGITPESDLDAVQFLVDHGLALLTFVDREIESSGDSLEQVEALLAGSTIR